MNKQTEELEIEETEEYKKIYDEIRSWEMREEDEIREEVVGLYVELSELEKYYLDGLVTSNNYVRKMEKIREKIDILNWVLGENKEEENDK